MSSQMGLPRMRTVFCVVGILLFCTFYWDLIALHRLHNPKQVQVALRHEQRTTDSLVWSWHCVVTLDQTKVCQRYMSRQGSFAKDFMSFATCSMTCSPTTRVWPQPTGTMKIGNTSSSFHPHQLKVNFTKVNDPLMFTLLKNMTTLFKTRIKTLSEKSHAHTSITTFVITIKTGKGSKYYRYKLNIDESYKLTVKRRGLTTAAEVMATSFLGVHHGMETLSQLIWWDDRHQVLNVLNDVVITDAPLFSYRGLLLDTARNFIPIPSILRTIDAMSMNKMNVFHWHMTDSKSFPFASKQYPGFQKFGPYSNGEVYSKPDIQKVVDYGLVRGVTVMIEIGALSQAGQGWEWGEGGQGGNLSVCLGSQPFTDFCGEPPCGQLNPANENSSEILAGLLTELSSVTKANLMHIGGDDVDFRCWDSSEEVTDMKIYLNKGVSGVWKLFYNNLIEKISKKTSAKPNFILWANEVLDNANSWKKQLTSSPIIECGGPSTSGQLERLVNDKYQVIVASSDVWTLSSHNMLLGVYLHRPWADLKVGDKRLVIGGEACAWTDNLDHHSLDATLWPAASAVAERLWSDLAYPNAAIERLAWFRERMVRLGIASSPAAPQWCLYNPNQCL